MGFDPDVAREIASKHCDESGTEAGLIASFIGVCRFLNDNPDYLSWPTKNRPGTSTAADYELLASKYFDGYKASDYPKEPGTVPDEMVSVVMETAYGYSTEDCAKIKVEHQYSMCAENCVGALLERYMDSVLRSHGWHWCCGDIVKAIDFIGLDDSGLWIPVQVKNRDNSENSSSAAIRNGTSIKKWFRTRSKSAATNWPNLPDSMKGYGLCDEDFVAYARRYLETHRP